MISAELRPELCRYPQAAPDEVAVVEQPAQANAEVETKAETKAQNKAKANAKKAKEAEEADANDEWVEDADGNFVKRGD